MAKTRQKPKPQAKKPSAKPKREKPTIEQLSDQERQRLLFSHKRKIKPLLALEAEAKAAVTKAYELAKKEGIPKSEIKLAIAFETEEGGEAQGKEMERIIRVARWMNVPLGAQTEMFGAGKQTRKEKIFEDGRVAALEDQPRKAPSHLANADADHWYEGFDAGRIKSNETRAGGFQKLGDVADTVLPLQPANGGAEAVDSLTAH